MAVNLTKGQRVSLKKDAPNLKRILVGLGWDPVEKKRGLFSLGSSAEDIDIDASVICIDENGREKEIVYFGHKDDRAGSIHHTGDNLTGEDDDDDEKQFTNSSNKVLKDDEQIIISLDKVPRDFAKLAIIINIFRAYSRGQHFGQIKNCFVHVADMDTNKELVYYDISGNGNFNGLTGIFVAEIYRYNGDWRLKAEGDGVKVRDIKEMVRMKCR